MTIRSEEAPEAVPPGDASPRASLRSLLADPRSWALIETALIALGLAALLELLTYQFHGDGQDRYTELIQLIDFHRLSPGKYSLIGPIFAVPLYRLGRLFGSDADWALHYDWALFAIGIVGAWFALRNRMDRKLLRTFFLLLIAASMFPFHLTSFYGEVFTVLGVGLGLLFDECGLRRTGWILIILGAANTPATLPALALVVGKRIVELRSLRPVLVFVAAVALTGAENWLRRGGPLNGGYGQDPGFTTPILLGLLAILFSFGKGLIFYLPGAFLPVRRVLLEGSVKRGRELYAAHTSWLLFGAGLVVIYAPWWAWYGGWYWGPRFFLILSLPAAFALAVRLRHPSASIKSNLLTFFVLALSVWIDIDGAVFGQQTLSPICQANNYAHEFYCHYLPQYSALWRPFFVAEPLSHRNELYIAYAVLVFLYLAIPLARVIVRQIGESSPWHSAVAGLHRGFSL